ncbi:MAG: hypothetical protein J7L61_03525 [Thermoplasmata archaeon]|nr:hypothetical protein [Thermoplasmata archaeon]
MLIVIPHTSQVEAYDVGSQPLVDVSAAAPNVAFHGMDWGTGASYGLAVGDGGEVYTFIDPVENGLDWTSVGPTNAADVWFGVTYDTLNSRYVFCGDGSGSVNNVYYYDGTSINVVGNTGAGDVLYDVAVGTSTGYYVVVGENGGNGVVYYYDGSSFYAVTDGGGTLPASQTVLNGVDYDPISHMFVIVGENTATGSGVIYVVNESALPGGAASMGLEPGDTATVDEPLYGFDWNTNSSEGYGLAVGYHSAVYKVNKTGYATNLSTPKGMPWPLLDNNPQWTLFDVDFAEEGDGIALIVGNDSSGNSLVLRYEDYNSAMGDGVYQATTNGTSASTYIECVAFKPYNSPRYAIMAGYTGGLPVVIKYSTVEAAGNINVNTIYPHIVNIEIWEGDPATGTNRLNDNVDVDPGTGTVYYTVRVYAYHQNGWDASVSTIDLYLLWDNGVTGSFTYPGGANANDHAHFLFTNGAPDTFTAPDGPGAYEIELLPPSCSDNAWATGPHTDGTIDHYVDFVFRLNKQVWAATGPFTEAAGTAASDQGDISKALNDTNTWDIQVTITDTASVGSDTKWDEFGVYKFTELTNAGLPADQSGSGAPSSTITLQPVGEDVTYSANCPYRLKVWVTDLTDGAGNTITADNLGVMGGDLDDGFGNPQHFGGAGEANALYLLGSGAPGWATVNPNANDNTTTTSNANNGGATVGSLTWECTIPAVAESYYYGEMHYVIERP